MGVKFATREQVADAPDIRAAAYAASRIDSVIESSSRDIERLLHLRAIAPTVVTRAFDFPSEEGGEYGRIWLEDLPMLSLTSALSGGVSIPAADFKLYPTSGAPYSRVELSRASAYGFNGSPTPQQSGSLTYLAGISNEEESAGTLSGALSSSATTVTVSGNIGVGRLLRVDSERMLVTDKGYVTTGQTGTLTASNAASSLAVTDGTAFSRSEEIYLDSERLMVQEVLGNTLIVQRATGGTVLAAHTSAVVFSGRSLTVQRGALGTTAASHSSGAALSRWVIPGPINELCIAFAVDRLLQRGTGWARTVGSGDAERAASGRGIKDLIELVYGNYGRKGRVRAV